MLTLTAPSTTGHDRWRVGNRGPRIRECGCDRHLDSGLAVWNAQASARWNALRTALVREYPGLIFLRAVEVQKRGALHLHILVWTPSAVVLERIQELAMRAGFGCVLDYAPCEPGSRRAAYYVAKYVTKACDSRSQVPWETVDVRTGELVAHEEARYRTWSSSRTWGLTMRQIEEAIRAAARRRHQPPAPVLEDQVVNVPADPEPDDG